MNHGEAVVDGNRDKTDREEESLRRRVLMPLTVLLLLFLGTLILMANGFLEEELTRELWHKQQTTEVVFKELIAQRGELMDATIDQIAKDKSLQQAMINGDRAALLRLAQPTFKALLAEHEITHFYFHDTKGINVLRVHQPDRFGDLIDRFTLKRSMKISKFSFGIELGPLGTFTLRTVSPWYVDGRLIGYIELGEEIDQLVRKLSTLTQTELLIAIHKSYLNRQSWEAGMKMLGRKGIWEHLPEVVVVDQTMPSLGARASAFLTTKVQGTPTEFEFTVDEREVHGRVLPLRDAADRIVGNFVVMHDMTEQTAKYRRSIALVAGFCLLMGGVLFASCYILLGKAGKV